MAERNITWLSNAEGEQLPVGITGQKCKNVSTAVQAILGSPEKYSWVAPVFEAGSDLANKITSLASDFASGVQDLLDETGISGLLEAGIQDTAGNDIHPAMGEGYVDNVALKLAQKAEELVFAGNLYSDTVKDTRIDEYDDVTADNWAEPSKKAGKAKSGKATAASVVLSI